MRLHAERLRPRMVRHADKKALVVPVMEVPTDAAGWAALVPCFRALIAEQVGDGRARLLECDFSTTTDVDRVASQIVLMDVYAPYFDFWLKCICGIPSITLTGTADDWRAIRRRVDVIAELELETWARSLAPILDQFNWSLHPSRAAIQDVTDRILADHEAKPAGTPAVPERPVKLEDLGSLEDSVELEDAESVTILPRLGRSPYLEGPAEVIGFYNLLESARIGTWTIRPASTRVDLKLESDI